MFNVNKVLLIIAIVLFVALAGTLIWQNWLGKPSYYAVYLKTGDLYFGQLSRFPYFGLSHIYIVQVNSQNPKNPVSVQKFSDIFWGPEDFMKINREEVVWYVKLKSDSQLISLIEANPNLTPSPANLPASNANPIVPNTNSQPSVPGAK
ncbi:hypothetical protein D4R51_04435 [bacterium]|nr:MAG: hypothetical protein D4R51_04435 [bacterium]